MVPLLLALIIAFWDAFWYGLSLGDSEPAWQFLNYIDFAHRSDKSFRGQIGVPVRDYLDIYLMQLWPNDFQLRVVNKSGDCIIFPKDLGLKLFTYQGFAWQVLPIGNRSAAADSSHNSDVITVNPQGDASRMILTDWSRLRNVIWLTCWSPMGSITRPCFRMRVVLQGTTCSQGSASGESFADYIDRTVDPWAGP